MSQNTQNSIITTASGILGGVTKAFSSFTIASINFHGIVEVAFYAAISAIVGYAVKVCIDFIKRILKK